MGLCSQCVGSAGTKTTQCNSVYPDTSHISRPRSSHLTGESIYGESVTGIPSDGAFLSLDMSLRGMKHVLVFVINVQIKSQNSDSYIGRQFCVYLVQLEHVILIVSTFRHGELHQSYFWSSLFFFKPKSIFGKWRNGTPRDPLYNHTAASSYLQEMRGGTDKG